MLQKVSIVVALSLSIGLVACASFTPPLTLSGRQKVTGPDTVNQYAPEVAPRLSALPISDPSCKATFDILARDYAGANRPQLMAIGDSLYNGVQSLRINWYLSEWSPPTLVALRLGLIEEKLEDRTGNRSFFDPQYPSYGQPVAKTANYGLDLENLPGGGLLKNAVGLGGVPRYQADALEHLLDHYTPPNGRAMVDNLAFSGASSVDVDTWTSGDHRHRARAMIALQRQHPISVKYLGEAFTSANASFVLNPTHNPCLDGMTPLAQVLFRQPVRLIINIGANNGIFAVAFAGATLDSPTCGEMDASDDKPVPRCDGTIEEFLTKRLLRDMRAAGVKLAKSQIKDVYINGIGRPSRPANVLFNGSGENPGATTALFIPTPISRADLDKANAAADDANAALRRLVDELNQSTQNGAAGPRFTFVDMDAHLGQLDYKGCVARREGNCETRKLTITANRLNDVAGAKDVLLDNRPYEVDPIPAGRYYPVVKAGGLFSLDNMHLSAVGYEVMARAVTDKMNDNGDPLMVGGKSCADKTNPDWRKTPPGACRYSMTLPGHAFADITRRKQVPLRVLRPQDVASLRDFQTFVKAFR